MGAPGGDVGLGTAPLALEHAFKAGHRADDEADILAALALQDAGANRRQRVGACDRCSERRDGNTDCRESHEWSPSDELIAEGTEWKRGVQNKALPKVAVKTSNV